MAKVRTKREYAVVRVWVDGGRIRHRTYRVYTTPEAACAAVNRLNGQPGSIGSDVHVLLPIDPA